MKNIKKRDCFRWNNLFPSQCIGDLCVYLSRDQDEDILYPEVAKYCPLGEKKIIMIVKHSIYVTVLLVSFLFLWQDYAPIALDIQKSHFKLEQNCLCQCSYSCFFKCFCFICKKEKVGCRQEIQHVRRETVFKQGNGNMFI